MTPVAPLPNPLGEATAAVVHELLLRGLAPADMVHVLAGALVGTLMEEKDRQLRSALAAAVVHCLGHAVATP